MEVVESCERFQFLIGLADILLSEEGRYVVDTYVPSRSRYCTTYLLLLDECSFLVFSTSGLGSNCLIPRLPTVDIIIIIIISLLLPVLLILYLYIEIINQ